MTKPSHKSVKKNIAQIEAEPEIIQNEETPSAVTTEQLKTEKTKKTTVKKKKSVVKTKTPVIHDSVQIHFIVRYHTEFGQSLFVTGDHALLGNKKFDDAFALEYLNDECWHGTLTLTKETLTQNITYNYLLKNTDGSFTPDFGNDKKITPAFLQWRFVQLNDAWNHAGFIANAFYTEPFQNILLSDHSVAHKKATATKSFTHIFRCKAPLLQKQEVLSLLGADKQFKNWNEASPLLMDKPDSEDFWEVKLNLNNAGFPIVYKYGVYNVKEKQFVRYEEGNNRILYDAVSKYRLSIINDGFAELPVTAWKGTGVAVPVFSLRSQKSLGAGEFYDIKLLADWCKQTGVKLIQLLPINDTSATNTWADSYPYSAISAFALHPIYLHVDKLIDKKDKVLAQKIKDTRAELNKLSAMDYETVINFKLEVLRTAFNTVQATVFTTKAFTQFFEENKHWLVPYAAFCYLRDKNGSADFSTWKDHAVYNEDEILKISDPDSTAYDEISFYYFLQFNLHVQLRDAVEYAHEKGIVLKGDIPIGIFRHSADAWQQPELYHMHEQAGAPPDDFAVKGQNWGFPIYNWQKMQEDGFAWWKNRFEQMSRYFDAFRIDHILGFFRIWSIPMHAVEGIMGRFIPALPIHINEFYRENIAFDHARYCRPFINEYILEQTFGDQREQIKNEFLIYDGFGEYNLKPEFDTQRKVEAHFEDLANDERNKLLKEGLYDLISNVILFEEAESSGQQFHFRFNAIQTSSFQHLDHHTQHLLAQLYNNYFYQRQDEFWKQEALKKLPALKRSTNMLVCGEDLGLVPSCVPDVMKDLGLLSLEIQRMPKNPTRTFAHPADAPYMSVVTPSTHDMNPIRAWWEEDRMKTQQFYNNEIGQWGDASFFCEPWVAKAILLQHLYSPAMWSIFQLQDLLAMDSELRRKDPHEERINDPSNPKHYWRYRMHLKIEELSDADKFNEELHEMIKSSGR